MKMAGSYEPAMIPSEASRSAGDAHRPHHVSLITRRPNLLFDQTDGTADRRELDRLAPDASATHRQYGAGETASTRSTAQPSQRASAAVGMAAIALAMVAAATKAVRVFFIRDSP
jgi:hypothetical protein